MTNEDDDDDEMLCCRATCTIYVITLLSRGMQCIAMSVSVCLSACLSAYISQELRQTFCTWHSWLWLGSPQLTLWYVKRTSGFLDDVTYYTGPYGGVMLSKQPLCSVVYVLTSLVHGTGCVPSGSTTSA